MTPNQRLDDIEQKMARQQRAPALPSGVNVEIDYEEVGRRLDAISIARAERLIEQGATVLTDQEIEALRPKDRPDGSMDYDQLGAYMDALYIAKLAEKTKTAGQPGRSEQNL